MEVSASKTTARPFTVDEDALSRTPVTRSRYTSIESHKRDLETVWRQQWLFADHASQVPAVSDFFIFSLTARRDAGNEQHRVLCRTDLGATEDDRTEGEK